MPLGFSAGFSKPEIARILNEIEQSLPFNAKKHSSNEKNHHEQTRSMQQRFTIKHVLNFLAVFGQAGNPFLEETQDLIALDTRNIAVRNAVKN